MHDNYKVKPLQIKQDAAFSLLIINKNYTTNSIKPFFSLLIIIKYYTTSSIKAFFSLLVINKYYTTNSIKPFVAVQFIVLNF